MTWLIAATAFAAAAAWAWRSDKKSTRPVKRGPRLRDPSYTNADDWFQESKTDRPI